MMLNLLQEVLFLLDYQHECLKQLKVISPVAEDKFKIIFFKVTRKIVEELNLLDRATHLLEEEEKQEECAVDEEENLHNPNQLLEDSVSREEDHDTKKTKKNIETEGLAQVPSSQYNGSLTAPSPSTDDFQTQPHTEVMQLENNVKTVKEEKENLNEEPKRQKIVLKSGRVTSGYIYESDFEYNDDVELPEDVLQFVTDDEYAPTSEDERLGKGDTVFQFNESEESESEEEETKVKYVVKYVKCSVCRKKVRSYELKHHMDRHNGITYPCDLCDKTFTTAAYIRTHKRNFHMEIEPVECEICKKKIKNWNCMKLHIKRVHDKAFARQCDVCGQVLSNKKILRLHIANAHSLRNFKCDDCGKHFGTNVGLLKHQREVHSTERHVSCDFCGKTFTREANLRVHVRIHTGEKPFVCDICGAGFVQYVELRLHNKKHVKEKENNASKKKIVNKKRKTKAKKQKPEPDELSEEC